MAGIEVELAVGTGKVIELAQLYTAGAQAELEIVEVAERVESGAALHTGIAQHPGLALEAGIAPALVVLDVGQVADAGIELCGLEVDRRLGIEIAKGQGTVVDTHFVEGDGHQLFQLLAPVSALAGLGCLFAGAVDEIEFRAHERHLGDHCVVIP
ncbi:hypothetical protein D9M71_712530 [compost metagenome]